VRTPFERSLRESDSRHRNLIHFIPDIVYKTDARGRFQVLNHAVTILGYRPAELIGKSFTSIIHSDDVSRIHRVLNNAKSFPSPASSRQVVTLNEPPVWLLRLANMEARLLPKAGEGPAEPNAIYGEISASAYYGRAAAGQNKKFMGMAGTIRDISGRQRSEEFLRKMFGVVDQSPVSIIITDKNGTIEYINPEFIRVRGYSPQEIIGKNVRVLKSNYHPPEFYEQLVQTLLRDGEWRGELINRKKDGKLYWESVTISSVRDPKGEISNFIAIQEDITEKKHTQKQLKTLKEKETMLREIHHRVKNNLQIISSLMNLQMHSIPDEQTIKVFKQCEDRIRAMALIHEKLYQSDDLQKIDFKEYLRSFVFHIIHSHRLDHGKIKIEMDIDNIFLNIDIAIPCGLIFNELVTNAIKHAFPRKKNGIIDISMKTKGKVYVFKIGDNGMGLPDDFDIKKTTSLGLQLVEMLVKQLRGTLESGTHGDYTVFEIVFPRQVPGRV
jgi:PAS domain S-box-containing protein